MLVAQLSRLQIHTYVFIKEVHLLRNTIGHSIIRQAASVFSSNSEAPLQKAMLQQTFVLFLSIQAHLEPAVVFVVESEDFRTGKQGEEQLRLFHSSPRESSLLFSAGQLSREEEDGEKFNIFWTVTTAVFEVPCLISSLK